MQIHTYLLKFAFVVIHSYIRNHSKQEFGADKIHPIFCFKNLTIRKKFEDLASTTHQS